MAKKLLHLILYLLFLLVSTLLLLEVGYRFYVVDFYKGSLIGLNSKEDLAPGNDQQTILVLGDSFTADTNSYVKYLRQSLPDFRIINAAVAGTCIRQHELMASSRIKRFDPDILIYQIYLGNDLLEYRHPTTGDKMSTLRKVYWWLSDRLLVLGYINAKLPQLKAYVKEDPNPGLGAKLSTAFAPEQYNRRIKMQFQIEPQLLEHTVLLQRERGKDFLSYTKDVADLLALAPAACRVVVLVMPHCAQLGTPYLERMEELGAIFENKEAFLAVDFPFYREFLHTLSRDGRFFINALEYLGDEDRENPYYYENDPHLNPAGQLRVGKALVDFLSTY